MVTKETVRFTSKTSNLLNTNRVAIFLELCIYTIMILAGVKGGVLPLFVFAAISLFLRKRKWRSLGFRKPENLKRILVMGIIHKC